MKKMMRIFLLTVLSMLCLSVFANAEMRMREDGLEVTDVNDLAAYVRSTISFGYIREWPLDELIPLLSAQSADGIIRIPKEYGLFICTEPKKA